MSEHQRRSRHARTAAAVLGILLGGAVLTTSPASADTAYPVPSSGRIPLTGHGFGHGHGLSQYGAQGAALQHLSARQILAFYYPGTSLQTSTSRIRVLISADQDDDVAVLPAAGMRVRDLADGTTFTLPAVSGLTAWRITPAAKDARISKVQYQVANRWHRYVLPGRTTLRGDGEFTAPISLTLLLPNGSHRLYRGALRSASPTPDSTTRATVNVTTRDKYVRGVVAAEMPASWSAAALQSQAIAARTYAAHSQAANPTRYYQVCDTTACQVYGGRGRETAATDAAVAATANQILTYRDEPAFTQFSASSGGWTAAGGAAYLVAKADPYDAWTGNRVHTWTSTVGASAVEAAYPAIGHLTSVQVTVRDGHGDWGGRARSVRLTGAKDAVTVSGESLRSRLGLRSTWFRLG